jgi:hypothetical protein
VLLAGQDHVRRRGRRAAGRCSAWATWVSSWASERRGRSAVAIERSADPPMRIMPVPPIVTASALRWLVELLGERHR